MATSTSDGPFTSNLRCPECAAGFHFTPSPDQPLQGGTFGVLSCGAHSYPVIDGVPVLRSGRIDVQDHMTGRPEVIGPSVDELLYLVRVKPLEALVDLLSFPPALPFNLEQRRGWRLPLTRGPLASLSMHNRRRLVRRMLGQLDTLCAKDWFDLSYLHSRNIDHELHPYFLNRFSQPRYLASLSLMSVLDSDPLPVLDLACGFGHLMHHLTVRERPVATVGMDRNFFQLWVARRFIAPGSQYVCADADRPLPFPDDSFSASICTDAFHLFDNQIDCFAELRRCARDGTVILDRVGNSNVEPHDSRYERDPAGYASLAGDAAWRMIGQAELVKGYLRGQGPQLAHHRDAAHFTSERWLSLVVTDDPALFRDRGRFGRLPHGEGPLQLNPIYRIERTDSGVKLLFEFPSRWYAFENAESLSYHATGFRLSTAEFEAAASGCPTGSTGDLVGKYVLLGMPERYTRMPTPQAQIRETSRDTESA